MRTQSDSSTRPAAQDAAPGSDRGSREERLARLDQLEREIATERDRLNRPDDGDRSGRPAVDERVQSLREVDLSELEEKVTEGQREAWNLGYQAGIADSQTRTGQRTPNPFHPLREL